MENENKFQGLYNQGLEETYTINQVEEALVGSDVSMNRDGKYFNISGDTPQIMIHINQPYGQSNKRS